MDGGVIMENGKKRTLEVRWHGRGGQGAKSASAILAEVLFEEGKHVQAFPEYGAERQGAPMRASTGYRILPSAAAAAWKIRT
jgi:2-oxoacid:acceptor oxidoreductase gamma subunit (pyruvate/2-ketoisovalerate family)